MLAARTRAAAFSTLVLLVAGCSDEQPASDSAARGTTVEAKQREDHWLELEDGTPAADWLAARSAANGKVLSQAELSDLKAALSTAVLRLGESTRMIANRAVQLEMMLKAIGHNEGAVPLVQKLTSVIGETGQTEGFGAISQHYYIMRNNGLSEDDALADLKRRYGPRS